MAETARKRLLVAEDNMEMRNLLKRTLTHEGFDVEVAANGREAVELLQSEREFDVLISDMRMPEKDGEQVLVEARRIRPGIRVVLITSYGGLEHYQEMMQKGAFEYITKPFKIPDLIEVIDRATRPVSN